MLDDRLECKVGEGDAGEHMEVVVLDITAPVLDEVGGYGRCDEVVEDVLAGSQGCDGDVSQVGGGES